MTSGEEFFRQLEGLHEDAYGWALACCGGDSERARDVLQDAYVKVAAGRAVFGGQSSLKTWWFGVVRLTAMESERRQRRWLAVIRGLRGAFSFSLASDGSAPADNIICLNPDVLKAALKHLPGRQAEVLHLVFYQGLSITEAALVMKVSVGAARSHYDRGKKSLRRKLAASATVTGGIHE